MKKVARVILIRHGESIWNCTDVSRGLTLRFTGWADVKLTELGEQQAAAAGRALKRFGIIPNVAYTSLLQRAKTTLKIMMETGGFDNHKIPIINSWRLNERHYGALVGLSKVEAVSLMGREQVHGWRRSWELKPPPFNKNDLHDWRHLITVQPKTIVTSLDEHTISINIEKDIEIPETESLEDCAKRAVLLWNSSIAPRLLLGQDVLIVAHANTMRALVKMIDGEYMTLKDIQEVLIPSACPLIYEFMYGLAPSLEPTMLGMRGRYLLTKEILRFSRVLYKHTNKISKPNEKSTLFLGQKSISYFEDLVEMSFSKAKSFCNAGIGRHVPVSITNYLGKYVFVNHAWSKLTGYSDDDVIGQKWKFLHGPKTSRESVVEMNAKVHSGLATNCNIICYHKDGTAFDWNMSIIPLYDWLYGDNGSTGGILLTDILKAQQAQVAHLRPKTKPENYRNSGVSSPVSGQGGGGAEGVAEGEEEEDNSPIASESDSQDSFEEDHDNVRHLIPSHFVCIVNSITARPDILPIGTVFSPVKPNDAYMYRRHDSDSSPAEERGEATVGGGLSMWTKDYREYRD